MGICVQLDSGGTLTPTGEPLESCSAYVLLSGSENAIVSAVGAVFGQPSQEQALAWFAGPFCFVVFLYLVGRGAGAVVNMFNDK